MVALEDHTPRRMWWGSTEPWPGSMDVACCSFLSATTRHPESSCFQTVVVTTSRQWCMADPTTTKAVDARLGDHTLILGRGGTGSGTATTTASHADSSPCSSSTPRTREGDVVMSWILPPRERPFKGQSVHVAIFRPRHPVQRSLSVKKSPKRCKSTISFTYYVITCNHNVSCQKYRKTVLSANPSFNVVVFYI